MRRALAGAAAAELDKTAAAAPAAVAPLADIHSVHVPELDAEHEACAAALADFARSPTRAAIEAVVQAYESHFEHEEALLDAHLYADVADGAGSGFSAEASARRSHYADHERMLSELRQRAAAMPAAGGAATAAFVDSVLRTFENHANVYDASYAKPLAAKLAAVAAQ